MKKSHFRRILSLILAICLVTLAAACDGGGATSTTTADGQDTETTADGQDTETTAAPTDELEDINLRLFFWFSAEDLPDWQAGIDSILEENKNITIDIETSPWAEYWTKLQTQVATNTQADILGMVSMFSDFYIENGALLSLTPYIERDNFDLDDFWPGMMEAYTVDGEVYAFPYDLSTNLFLVNMDILDEAGVEVDHDGWTMDEFVENTKKITEETGVYAINFYPAGWVIYDYLLATGVPTLQDANGHLSLDTPLIAERLQWIADFNLEHEVAPVYDPTSTGLFESGNVAMQSANPEWVARMRVRMPDVNLDVMNYPYVEGMPRVRVSEGGSFTISAYTEYPDVCWDFVSAFTSAETLETMIGLTHRGIPGRESISQSMLESPNMVPHSEMFFDILEGSTHVSYPRRTEVETILGQYMEQIYLGQMTAEEAMPMFMDEATELMNE